MKFLTQEPQNQDLCLIYEDEGYSFDTEPHISGSLTSLMIIPKEPEKSDFRLERKLPRIDDRRLLKLIRINPIRINLRSSILGALAKPKTDFSGSLGIMT